MVWCCDLNENFLIVSGCSQSKFCPSNDQNNLVRSPNHLPVPPFTFLILQKSGVHLSINKEAWTQCKGASSQAGQKKSALAECPCLALVKTSIWKREVNEERSAWEDRYVVWSPKRRAFRQEFTAVQHALCKPECSYTSEVSSGQPLSGGQCREHPRFPSFFPLPFSCSLFYTQTSRICSGWQI